MWLRPGVVVYQHNHRSPETSRASLELDGFRFDPAQVPGLEFWGQLGGGLLAEINFLVGTIRLVFVEDDVVAIAGDLLRTNKLVRPLPERCEEDGLAGTLVPDRHHSGSAVELIECIDHRCLWRAGRKREMLCASVANDHDGVILSGGIEDSTGTEVDPGASPTAEHHHLLQDGGNRDM